jgi:hypothetical protein
MRVKISSNGAFLPASPVGYVEIMWPLTVDRMLPVLSCTACDKHVDRQPLDQFSHTEIGGST